MSSALAGHGALIAIEKDGDAGGTFTVVAEQTGDLELEMMSNLTDVTPHNDTIDAHIPGVKRRASFTVSGNFLFGNDTHDHLTGLQKRWIDQDKFGVRWRGPSGAASSDEVILSCYVANFKRTAPRGDGPYGFECTLQPSGPMIIDGVTVGTVG